MKDPVEVQLICPECGTRDSTTIERHAKVPRLPCSAECQHADAPNPPMMVEWTRLVKLMAREIGRISDELYAAAKARPYPGEAGRARGDKR